MWYLPLYQADPDSQGCLWLCTVQLDYLNPSLILRPGQEHPWQPIIFALILRHCLSHASGRPHYPRERETECFVYSSEKFFLWSLARLETIPQLCRCSKIDTHVHVCKNETNNVQWCGVVLCAVTQAYFTCRVSRYCCWNMRIAFVVAKN